MNKYVVISDTHGQHKKLDLPPGDVIIHAGDVTTRGYKTEILQFLDWFKELNYNRKIFIAGNHDFYFEEGPADDIKEMVPQNVEYLCDSSIIVDDIKIWGSPVSPWFNNWAFNRHRGDEIRKHWSRIPADTDILITHGPAFGYLDKTKFGEEVGCKDLLAKVKEIKPKYHLCGHVHEGYGEISGSPTTFINASVLDANYKLNNAPIIFDI